MRWPDIACFVGGSIIYFIVSPLLINIGWKLALFFVLAICWVTAVMLIDDKLKHKKHSIGRKDDDYEG